MYPAAAINTEERHNNQKVLPYTTGVLSADAYKGCTTQYTNNTCVSAMNSRLGQRTNFKNAVSEAAEGDTWVSLKPLTPVRMLKNDFFKKVREAEINCASKEDLEKLLGKGRAKKGIFEGDLSEGELEIGQVSSLIKKIAPASEIIREIWNEFKDTLRQPVK